jgi:ABC-2 type transporter
MHLPMARSAVLAGRTLADLARNVVTVALMVAVGTAVGFRFHAGPAAAVAALVWVLAFGYAFSWVFATIGLVTRNPEAAQFAAGLPLFLLVFASSAFVPVQTMPGWLQAFANVQPVSVTVDAVRPVAGRSHPPLVLAVTGLDGRDPPRLRPPGRPPIPAPLTSYGACKAALVAPQLLDPGELSHLPGRGDGPRGRARGDRRRDCLPGQRRRRPSQRGDPAGLRWLRGRARITMIG